MLAIGSLFSGIGGLELGLEACGLGPVLWQAEIDPFCRAVLAKHWPDARRYEDVRAIDETTERPDVICGGFPCQDLSLAGKRAGLGAERSGLWWEFRRIVRVLQPRFVVVENVFSAWRNWLPIVRRGLWKVGYASVPVRVSAADVGADHERARCFVVAAYANRQRLWVERGRGEPGSGKAIARHDGAPQRLADAEGERCEARRADQLAGIASVTGGDGDACQATHAQRTTSQWPSDLNGAAVGWAHPDADRGRQLQPERRLSDEWGRASDGDGWAVEPVLRGGDHGLPGGLDRRAAARQSAAREKALGNAVVPQAAREAWMTAMELTGWAP